MQQMKYRNDDVGEYIKFLMYETDFFNDFQTKREIKGVIWRYYQL
jgi:hypothetical protein